MANNQKKDKKEFTERKIEDLLANLDKALLELHSKEKKTIIAKIFHLSRTKIYLERIGNWFGSLRRNLRMYIYHKRSNRHSKKEDLRRVKLESELNPEEKDLRTKIIKVRVFHAWPGDPGYKDIAEIKGFFTSQAQEVEDKKESKKRIMKNMIDAMDHMNELIILLQEITKRAKLAKIKDILTPEEYERFMPIYIDFKQTGKFRMSNPHIRY